MCIVARVGAVGGGRRQWRLLRRFRAGSDAPASRMSCANDSACSCRATKCPAVSPADSSRLVTIDYALRRERPCPPAPPREARTAPPARQARSGDPNGAGAGGYAVRRVDGTLHPVIGGGTAAGVGRRAVQGPLETPPPTSPHSAGRGASSLSPGGLRSIVLLPPLAPRAAPRLPVPFQAVALQALFERRLRGLPAAVPHSECVQQLDERSLAWSGDDGEGERLGESARGVQPARAPIGHAEQHALEPSTSNERSSRSPAGPITRTWRASSWRVRKAGRSIARRARGRRLWRSSARGPLMSPVACPATRCCAGPGTARVHRQGRVPRVERGLRAIMVRLLDTAAR